MMWAPLCLVVMIQNSGDDDGVDHDVGHDFEVEDAVATLVILKICISAWKPTEHC